MIKETENKIDGLVNNAGVMFAPRSYTEDGIETHWAVNHLSHFLLTRLLTDRLENGGRVLFMTHLDYRKARDGIKFNDINMENSYDKSYAFYQSQLANVLLFQELAEEFKPLGISVNAIYPGIVSGTNLKRHMGVGKSYLSQHIVKPVLWLVERNATEGAHTPLYMLTDRKVVHETGKMFVTMSEMAILPIGLDKEAAKKVVAIGDYWTGLKSKSELVTNKSAE
jgi:retinol dehydrogenase-12